MSLDDLEKQIYQHRKKKLSPKTPPQEEFSDGKQKKEIRGWDYKDEKKNEKRHKRAKKVIFVSVIFSVIAVLVVLGTLFFMRDAGGNEGVDIVVHAPSEVHKGAPFEINVQISNDIDTFLRDAELSLTLSSGLVSLDELRNKTTFTDDMGDIGGGSLTRKTYRLVSRGLEQTLEKVTIELSYVSEGKNILQVKEVKEVFVGDSAIKLAVTMPEQILQGSEFSFEVGYENVSQFDFEDILIELQYPPQFEFTNASIPPDSLDNVWRFNEIQGGSKGGIQVEGVLSQNENNPIGLRTLASTNVLGKQVTISEIVQDFTLAPSPVRLQVLLNNSTNYFPNIGETLEYKIQYENMSGIALADVVLSARFDSELLVPQTFKTKGNFNSVTNTVTWTAANVPSFKILEPGASGEAYVTTRLRPTFPITRPGDRNYTVSVNAKLDSPSVPYYLSTDTTTAVSTLNTKVRGLAIIDSQALFRDPSSGIVNSGTVPPVVNNPTQYTVHWIIKNFSTDLSGVTVRSSLESGVEWTGIVKSNTDSVPLYNERTQEVVWTIDKVQATKGIIGEPFEAIFQIEATPNSAQAGNFQPLTQETILTATDEFTDLEIRSTDTPLSTKLEDDSTTSFESGRVIR